MMYHLSGTMVMTEVEYHESHPQASIKLANVLHYDKWQSSLWRFLATLIIADGFGVKWDTPFIKYPCTDLLSTKKGHTFCKVTIYWSTVNQKGTHLLSIDHVLVYCQPKRDTPFIKWPCTDLLSTKKGYTFYLVTMYWSTVNQKGAWPCVLLFQNGLFHA